MEIALTGVLLSVILGTASAAQNVGDDRRARRRRLHRPGRPVVGAGQRHLDEPSALVRPGAWSAATGPPTGCTSPGR